MVNLDCPEILEDPSLSIKDFLSIVTVLFLWFCLRASALALVPFGAIPLMDGEEKREKSPTKNNNPS